MAITLSASDVPGAPLSARLTPQQVWGIVLLAPHFLVFAAFVVYPIGYGLWLARAAGKLCRAVSTTRSSRAPRSTR